MLPGQHLVPEILIYPAFSTEKIQHGASELILQKFGRQGRQELKYPVLLEDAISHQDVEIWMKVDQIAKGLDEEDKAFISSYCSL